MKAVIFVAENLYGPRFWVPFFKKLKAATGVKVYCLAPTFAHVNDYQKHRDVIDGIIAIDGLLASYRSIEPEFDEEAKSLATHYEQTYSAHLFDVIQGDRHLGRGTYYLGHHHPKSRNSADATLGRSIRFIHQLAEYLDEQCAEYKIGTFISSGIGSEFTKIMCDIARKRGIDIRILFSARLGQFYTWYHDEFFQHPLLTKRFLEMQSRSVVAGKFVGELLINKANAAVRAKSFRYMQTGFAVKQTIRFIINDIRFILVSNIKYRDKPKFNRYLLRDRIRHLFKIPKQWKDLNNRAALAESFAAHRYVYYALQVEPETSTTVQAPEFNSQIGIIDLISKSLPADVLFVIKEHMPGVGRRPDDFYEWLSEIPNVRLAPPASDGPTLAKGAALVVALTGSVGLEAASEGVPIVAFGRHNAYNAMKHVYLVENLFSMRDLLKKLLDADRRDRQSVRKKNRKGGQLFNQVLRDVSFDIGNDQLYHGDPTTPVRSETIEGLMTLLISFSSHMKSRHKAHPKAKRRTPARI